MFDLHSKYEAKGDQPKAIKSLVDGLTNNYRKQTLLGVTGSGKTFTMANVINNTQKSAIILTHSKTLANQLYKEFKDFFPNNNVHYFISYYDFYLPERYNVEFNEYREKETEINNKIKREKLMSIRALMQNEKTIIIASVSAIYGLPDPQLFRENVKILKINESYTRTDILNSLFNVGYKRNNLNTEILFGEGDFRVSGDTIDFFPNNNDNKFIRLLFFGNELEKIQSIDFKTNIKIQDLISYTLFPNSIYFLNNISDNKLKELEEDYDLRMKYFKKNNLYDEMENLKNYVGYSIEMIKNRISFDGIENYSYYFSNRSYTDKPYCLLDYFNDDYLTFIDESHVTLPQIKAMSLGDRARKSNLIQNGYLLTSAIESRPLHYDEFLQYDNSMIFVSATPGNMELEISQNIAEQIIRPTGLIDPNYEIIQNNTISISDMGRRIRERLLVGEKCLLITATKNDSITMYELLINSNIKADWINSDLDLDERIDKLDRFKMGEIDVLVGINLLREGLDLPMVSLILIMDADKEGFLRSTSSLIQIAGRAARNVNGLVVLYCKNITKSIENFINETERRRNIQMEWNNLNGIIPKTINKNNSYNEDDELQKYYDDVINNLITKLPKSKIKKIIEKLKKEIKLETDNENYYTASELIKKLNIIKNYDR